MPDSTLPYAPILRVSGRDATAREVLVQALKNPDLKISGDLSGQSHEQSADDATEQVVASVLEAYPVTENASHAASAYVDPYQVDPALSVTHDSGAGVGSASAGSTYAGLAPPQRGAFLTWAQDPALPAPPAFQRLLIAHIEVTLLQTGGRDDRILGELIRWSMATPWHHNEWLAKAILLSLWLASNGAGIAKWTSLADVAPTVLELALGLQTLLYEELQPPQIATICRAWRIPSGHLSTETASLRLRSITEELGAGPLTYVHGQISPLDLRPKPWRAAHRDLRFSLPQPSIRPLLQPLLKEIATSEQNGAISPQSQTETSVPSTQHTWLLILEFGHSRSDFYPIVLELARRMPSYVQLLDENRRLVHRVAFEKRDIRKFWRIWDYVQNWSTTHIYLDGQELEHWKVWPYSQYLR